MNEEAFAETMNTLVPLITRYGLQIIGAVLILIGGRILAGILASLTRRALLRARAESSLVGFLVNLVRVAVIAFAVIASLAEFGVQTTSFVALLGAAGFAVGMALQGSLASFAAGVMILIFRPIQVGDLIESNGYLGRVAEIGLFATILNTLDNQKVIIPNSTLTGGVITNVNSNGTRRVDLTAGIGYGDDIGRAKEILNRIARSHPKVLSEPAAQVAVSNLGESSVDFVVRPWCRAEDYWDVWFDLTESIKREFDTQGVNIPFPQRDVHLFQAQS